MNCWQCDSELIWGGDHSFSDYGMEEEGIVTNLTCPGCESFVLVHTPLTEPLPDFDSGEDPNDRWGEGYRVGYHQMKQFLGKQIEQLEKERNRWKEIAQR